VRTPSTGITTAATQFPVLTTTQRLATTTRRSTTTTALRNIPSSVNFTDSMQQVKDQLDCGSCYAFAAVAVVEYKSKVASKKDENLSEQNIVDCQPNGYGCNGDICQSF
jgi:C1A family cysteine protease